MGKVRIQRDEQGDALVTASGAVTRNKLEIAAALQLEDDGYTVIRNGWPDFLAIKGDQVLFVEVKPAADPDQFSEPQRIVLTTLRNLGLNVKLITPRASKPQRPTLDALRLATLAIGDAKTLALILGPGSKDADWLPQLAWAIHPDTVVILPASRHSHDAKPFLRVLDKRLLKYQLIPPKEHVANRDDYELSAAKRVAARTNALITVHNGLYPPALWTFAAFQNRLKPAVSLNLDASLAATANPADAFRRLTPLTNPQKNTTMSVSGASEKAQISRLLIE